MNWLKFATDDVTRKYFLKKNYSTTVFTGYLTRFLKKMQYFLRLNQQ